MRDSEKKSRFCSQNLNIRKARRESRCFRASHEAHAPDEHEKRRRAAVPASGTSRPWLQGGEGEVMPHCTSGRGSTRLWFPAVGQRWVGLSQTSCALSDHRYVAAEGKKALLSPNTSCGVTSTREGKRRRHQSALWGAVRFRPPLSVALTAVGVECQTRSPPSISLAAKHPEKIYVWQDSQGEKKISAHVPSERKAGRIVFASGTVRTTIPYIWEM